VFVKKKLPEQLGLHCYAVSTHPDELVLEPPPYKNHGSAYGGALVSSDFMASSCSINRVTIVVERRYTAQH